MRVFVTACICLQQLLLASPTVSKIMVSLSVWIFDTFQLKSIQWDSSVLRVSVLLTLIIFQVRSKFLLRLIIDQFFSLPTTIFQIDALGLPEGHSLIQVTATFHPPSDSAPASILCQF